MIKMLDKFMYIVAECDNKNEIRFPIKQWKVIHRKVEIIKEIKNKEFYSPEDICNYGWIIMWAMKKWENTFSLPDNFSFRGVDNFCYFEYKDPNGLHFGVTALAFPNIREVKLDIHFANRNVTTLSSNTGLDFKNYEYIEKIMKEFFIGTIKSILNRIIRGD